MEKINQKIIIKQECVVHAMSNFLIFFGPLFKNIKIWLLEVAKNRYNQNPFFLSKTFLTKSIYCSGGDHYIRKSYKFFRKYFSVL